MDDLEYIVTGALTQCTKGVGIAKMTVTSNTTTHIQKQLVATDADKTYMVNIPTYGFCNTTQSPCKPTLSGWIGTYEPVKVNGHHPLIATSCLLCAVDATSKITFLTSGQLPLNQCFPSETLDAISEANTHANELSDEYDLERRAWVKGSGFWEGFIPVWGSGKDYLHCIETKHYWTAAMHAGLVVLDVFTLGIDELAIGAIKGGVKGAVEAGGKIAVERIAAAMAAKEAAIMMAKKAFAGVAELSIKKLGICIAKACFCAGTIVQTKDGPKNIEALQSGDEVWAYDETTGQTGLQPVLNVFEHETNTIIALTADGETIYTTPEHPFYANSQWKEAGRLQPGDTLQLFNGKAAIVEQINYKFDEALLTPEEDAYKPTTVYNIEVNGWQTYFVGLLWLLVHNAACVAKIIEATVGWAKNAIKGTNYREIFFKVYSDLRGKVWVHHAVEKNVMTRFPGRFMWEEIHSLENLRGIPTSINADLHLSKIRKAWDKFQLLHPNATREEILKYATELDKKFGNLFNPPLF